MTIIICFDKMKQKDGIQIWFKQFTRRTKMRMPNEGEDLTGKVCVCTVGRAFIVTGKHTLNVDATGEKVEGWCGLGFDGKGTAFSSDPCVIAESGQEFHDKLSQRFGGKLSYNA